ncbi:MAG: response regulator transcription factor [Chitinophagales bacterium]|nr:response regulator transcription factor [Chitinophagales bacterium]
MGTIKILLYEDNQELRLSLSALLGFSDEFKLLASFPNCEGIESHLKMFDPDLILMDIDMPIVNGIEGLKRVRKVDNNIPVVMLTVFEDNKHIIEAIQNGATGYILKQHLSSRLSDAIHEALEGGAPMSPLVASLVLKHISKSNRQKKDYQLTNREKEILQSLTDGNSYKMVANILGIADGTVRTHIKRIYEKLDVHSQAEAVSKTLKENII